MRVGYFVSTFITPNVPFNCGQPNAGKLADAVAKNIDLQHMQNNPNVADDTQEFIGYYERMQKEYTEKSREFVRYIAEGNLVKLHTHQT